jgi:hypothetical protein
MTTQTDTLPDRNLVTHHPDRVAHAFPWDATHALCGIPATHANRHASPDARKCPECEHLAAINRFCRR